MTRELALGVAQALLPGAAAADGIMLIQAGAFWMGSDSDDPNEAPLHRVYVLDFWSGSTGRLAGPPAPTRPIPASRATRRWK